MTAKAEPRPAETRPGPVQGLATEARSLRRKLQFWRRAVWFFFGAVGIIALVLWQRGQSLQRECRQALEHYAVLAEQSKLGQESADALEMQWQSLEKKPAKLSAVHYDLIVRNWHRTPQSQEALPLAVCRDSHPAIFSRGRHVLMRDPAGHHIDWLDENRARPYVDLARADNRTP